MVYLFSLKIGNPFTSDPSLPFIVARGEAHYKKEGSIPFFERRIFVLDLEIDRP